MTELTSRRCKPCKEGTPPLTRDQAGQLLEQLGDWTLADDGKLLRRAFRFKNYFRTMAFINAVAWIAHQEDHHPDMEVGYSSCVVKYSTHSIGGLSGNDFICAAKIDALLPAE